MNKISIILAITVLISSNVMFAQKSDVDIEKSSIHWLGKKITGQHEGNILLKKGSLELKDDKIVAGNFVIDMTTITNTDLEDEDYNKKLVGHLKSDDFFGVEKFPTANFTITKSTKFSDGKAKVIGNITIKAKTETIIFDVTKKGNIYTAKIDIDRSKFDVKYGSDSFFDNLGDKTIDDMFQLTIKLVVK